MTKPAKIIKNVWKYCLSPNVISISFNFQVCANPRPEVFWHTTDGIITPEKASSRFAVTSLSQRTTLKHRSDPLSTISYCYRTSLLIDKVHENDEFRLSIRGDLDIMHEELKLKVKVSECFTGNIIENKNCLFQSSMSAYGSYFVLLIVSIAFMFWYVIRFIFSTLRQL